MIKFLGATLILFCLTSPLQAWDESGHRFTATIAYNYFTEETKQNLFELLTYHPRYDEDFVQHMPREIQRGSLEQRQRWLLGQAAFWPDIARRLSRQDRERFNHPNWHYIDGALVRGNTTIQGNRYINIEAFPARQTAPIESPANRDSISNIFEALDYSAAVLSDTTAVPAEKALALCWILHLIGDIHQPLHAGSMFSAKVFPTGDGGGNGIEANGRTLHAIWDRALTNLSENQVRALLDEIFETPSAQAPSEPEDWSTWMQESRVILRSSSVYDQRILDAISAADQNGSPLPEIQLGERYIAEMTRIATNRLTSAGMRLAVWFNQNSNR